MSLHSPQSMEMQISVMPASGSQDASGDIHVNLDSSTPCWNDAIERFCLNRYRPLRPYFRRSAQRPAKVRTIIFILLDFVLFASFVLNALNPKYPEKIRNRYP